MRGRGRVRVRVRVRVKVRVRVRVKVQPTFTPLRPTVHARNHLVSSYKVVVKGG